MKNITPTRYTKLLNSRFGKSASGLLAHCRRNPADILLVLVLGLTMDIENGIDALEEAA